MALVLKIKIKESTKPPIWRKIKINQNTTFEDFHYIIQIAFGWEDEHLYQFSPKGWNSYPVLIAETYMESDDLNDFSDPKTFPNGERYDVAKIKLKDYFKKLKQKMIYIYDFGDDWEHQIELVEITDEVLLHPMCISGKGSDLEEDCGGIWGFYNMVDAINNPKHPEHKDFMEWLGLEKGTFWDINKFDIDEINEYLNKF